MHRICWPWCPHRKEIRAIRADIAATEWVEAVGGWIPARERDRIDTLKRKLEELDV